MTYYSLYKYKLNRLYLVFIRDRTYKYNSFLREVHREGYRKGYREREQAFLINIIQVILEFRVDKKSLYRY